MYRVVATDLDATLLRSDKTISALTMRVLQQWVKAGGYLVLATARPPRSIKEILPGAFPPAYRVAYNGAEIVDTKGHLLQATLLKPSKARRIIETVLEYEPHITVSIEKDDLLYANRPLPPFECRVTADLTAELDSPVAKIIVDGTACRCRSAWQGIIAAEAAVLVTDGGRFVQIAAKGVSKAAALRFLLRQWGLHMQQVVAFGDDAQDCTLLQEAGLGVAVANAAPPVLAAADYITDSNDDDGVARFVAGLLRKEGEQSHSGNA